VSGAGRVRAVAAIAAGALLLGSIGVGAQERASLPDIEDEVMCPICGTTLELSEAPQAERERALIRRLIDEGKNKEEIKDALVAEYGPEVLAVPDAEGFDISAWIVPLIGLAAAGVGIGLALARRRREDGLAPEPLPPADLARLAEDIDRHER
jgi:cytochrome c-type biogenesis protein CcmH